MTSINDTVASYVPWLVARQQISGLSSAPLPSSRRFPGAVLLADVTGFTALTERLAEAGPEGAEVLTNNLNAFFSPVIDLVSAHGGDIVKFAGDAILAVWHGGDRPEPPARLARRAVQCGLALQRGAAASLPGLAFPLSLKVCIGAGDLALAHLGGERNRWEAVLLGEPISGLATAARAVSAGQVALAPEAWDLVSRHFQSETAPGGVRLVAGARWPVLRPRPLARLPAAPAAVATLTAYLPGAIRARVSAGQAGWLAEIRRISAIFVSLPDLAWDTPLERSQAIASALQRALYRYEGSLNKLSVDEKGVALLAAMGLPPLAHRDDAERAVLAALEMRDALTALGCRGSIGVASGPAFCGEVGNALRREYTIMGDVVNLAARLMQAAAGDVLCDEATFRQARARIAFANLPRQVLKGKTGMLGLFRPAEIRQDKPAARGGAMVGRAAERLALERRLHRLRDEQVGGAIVVEGEAGIGKSRLVGDFLERAEAIGVGYLIGQGDPIDHSAPFHAWRPIFEGVFGISAKPGDRKQVAELRERVLAKLGADTDALARAPLLNAVLPLDLPETDLTRELEDKVRAQNTLDLLVALLGGEARAAPLAIVLDDAQWLDSASWILVAACAARVRRVLLLVAARPISGEGLPEFAALAEAADTLRMRLDEMPAEEALETRARETRGGGHARGRGRSARDAGGGPPVLHRGTGAGAPRNGRPRDTPGQELQAHLLRGGTRQSRSPHDGAGDDREPRGSPAPATATGAQGRQRVRSPDRRRRTRSSLPDRGRSRRPLLPPGGPGRGRSAGAGAGAGTRLGIQAPHYPGSRVRPAAGVPAQPDPRCHRRLPRGDLRGRSHALPGGPGPPLGAGGASGQGPRLHAAGGRMGAGGLCGQGSDPLLQRRPGPGGASRSGARRVAGTPPLRLGAGLSVRLRPPTCDRRVPALAPAGGRHPGRGRPSRRARRTRNLPPDPR
ncbi:MAG: adenylate/guanylate cyclase domain-containing protein [Candidatus Sericytochromatia bacterium]|nr:adenylate/guanylate cyclase domain-containing protein [Candidatus Tanganyikabacteria bacterium]